LEYFEKSITDKLFPNKEVKKMNPSDSCQLKVLDRIYYVNVEDVKNKIKNGTVLRQDQIKVGNPRICGGFRSV
jgi:hypothetical protein